MILCRHENTLCAFFCCLTFGILPVFLFYFIAIHVKMLVKSNSRMRANSISTWEELRHPCLHFCSQNVTSLLTCIALTSGMLWFSIHINGRDLPDITVLWWDYSPISIVIALYIVATTMVNGNTLHVVLVKEWTGRWTIWVATFMMKRQITHNKYHLSFPMIY